MKKSLQSYLLYPDGPPRMKSEPIKIQLLAVLTCFPKKDPKEQNTYMPSKVHMEHLHTKPQMTMYPILHTYINNFHKFSITQT